MQISIHFTKGTHLIIMYISEYKYASGGVRLKKFLLLIYIKILTEWKI